MDVDNLVKGCVTKPTPQPSAVDTQPAPPAPAKKKPFIPPLLGAKNLGMSTLIQENGKTQEEMDVDNLVKGGPPKAAI